MKVTLDTGEMATAQYHATLRRAINQASKVTDQRRDSASQAIMLDIVGMVAEIAWHRVMGTFPDLSVSPRAGSADAMYQGRTIDIKATTRRDGRLLATTNKGAGAADFYVLAIVDEANVDFVGYAASADLLSKDTIVDLGHGPTHALPQSRLRRFKQDEEAN